MEYLGSQSSTRDGGDQLHKLFSNTRYSKAENITDFSPYTHLVTETPSIEGFQTIYIQEGYEKLIFKYPFIQLAPKVYVMKKIKK